MDMKRLALIAMAVALAVAPTAEAAPAKKRRCAERGPDTVTRSLDARLFVESDGYDHQLVGCHFRTGRRWVVATWYSCGCSVGDASQPQAWLTGRFVAVNTYSCSPISLVPECGGRLRVYDLRRGGKARHEIDTGGPVSAPLLKRNGSIALLVGGRLIRVDTTGTAVLDEGPGIDADSLAASRNRLYWMRGDAPQTAPFN
jgi:hypothetical protein